MDMLLSTNEVTRIVIDDVLVQYQIFDTVSPVMVTFPPGSEFFSEEHLKQSKPAWGFDLFASQQMNVIAFNHIGKDNHFDSPALAIFIQKLGKALEVFPEAIGYGVSRGAFAMALFADRFKLSRALLLMPLSTYNPEVATWDPKLKKGEPKSQRVLSLDASSCQTPLTIIYDPLLLPDRLHKQRLTSCVEQLIIPGVGHRIARALLHMGMLKSVVLEYRQGSINAERFYAGIRQRRNLSYYFRDAKSVFAGKLSYRRLGIIYFHKLKFYQQKYQTKSLAFLLEIHTQWDKSMQNAYRLYHHKVISS